MKSKKTEKQEEGQEISNMEEKKAQIIDKYKTQIVDKSNMFAKLNVPYDDLNVLLENTEELELVNSFFESISCEDKGIETLLYEVMGYAMTKTAKLNKAFIFKGNGRNGKSKIFRILEALLREQCSHEHLEHLSGSKSTVKKLKRMYC